MAVLRHILNNASSLIGCCCEIPSISLATQRLLTTLMGQRPAKVVATRYNMEVGVRVDYSCQKLLRGNYFHILADNNFSAQAKWNSSTQLLF